MAEIRLHNWAIILYGVPNDQLMTWLKRGGSGRIDCYRETQRALFLFLWLFSLNIFETTDVNVLPKLRRRSNERRRAETKESRLAHRGANWRKLSVFLGKFVFSNSCQTAVWENGEWFKSATQIVSSNGNQSLEWHFSNEWMGVSQEVYVSC